MQQDNSIPKISVCIPTWNRSKFLDWQLTQFAERRAEIEGWEFVVSDNASSDDTQSVALKHSKVLNLKYHRMPENVGAELNIANTYRMASSQHAVYLADDDMLDIPIVNGYVEALIKNPQVSALYAPWFIKDMTTEDNGSKFYHHAGTKGVQKEDYSALVDFVLDNKIFPEIVIARKKILEKRVRGHRFSFMYFAWLLQAVDSGDLIFAEKPFYFSLINHPAGSSEHLAAGIKQTMDSWDEYRGGFEVLLDLAARKGNHSDPSKLALAKSKLDDVVIERMLVALRLNIQNGNFLDAYWLYLRLGASTGMHRKMIDFETVCGLATLDYLVQESRVDDVCGLMPDIPEGVRDLALRFGSKKYAGEANSGFKIKIGFDSNKDQLGFGDAYAMLSML